MTRNNGSNTDDRNPDGTFASGNPGKPKGSRHKATQAIEAMLEGQQEALTQAAIDKAPEGDVTALRLCLDRIAPARKDAPEKLPQIHGRRTRKLQRRFEGRVYPAITTVVCPLLILIGLWKLAGSFTFIRRDGRTGT